MRDKSDIFIGSLFIIVGFILVGFGLLHPVTKWLVLLGVGVAVFGALVFPSRGTKPALQTIVVAIGSLPIFGGRRVGDPPASTIIPTQEEKKP